MKEECQMSALSDQIRKMFGEGDAKRDAGLKTPDDIIRYDDIRYGTEDDKLQMLDVYRPKGISGKLPVIMSVHGGGWVYGDKEVYQFYCMSLAQRGFAVVNYSYRLAPEYKFPASLEDTCTVGAWMLTNAETYGFDMEHVYGVGDSAGGHMLTIFAAALTNPDYAAELGIRLPTGFRFNAVALNCGAYKIELSAQDMTTGLMGDFLPGKDLDAELKLINPVEWITEDFPPAFVMTSTNDFLKGQPAVLVPVLMDNDIPFMYRYYSDKENPIGHVFHCNIRLSAAKLCNDEECDFFRKY